MTRYAHAPRRGLPARLQIDLRCRLCGPLRDRSHRFDGLKPLETGPGDVFVVPSWRWHSFEASEDMVVFAFSDEDCNASRVLARRARRQAELISHALCFFADHKLGLVDGGMVRDVTEALDVLRRAAIPIPTRCLCRRTPSINRPNPEYGGLYSEGATRPC